MKENKCGCSIWDSENGSFLVIVIPIIIIALVVLVYSHIEDNTLKEAYKVKSELLCKSNNGLLHFTIRDDKIITICANGYSDIQDLR